MPDLNHQIVINTSPLLALCAACGDFVALRQIYQTTIVPYEVVEEISSCKFSCDRNGGAGKSNQHHLTRSMGWMESTPWLTLLPLAITGKFTGGKIAA